jgi:hypothetical protein
MLNYSHYLFNIAFKPLWNDFFFFFSSLINNLHYRKRDGTKLDWMYQGPGGAVDREEYLLGRAVDKNLEEQLQAEKSGVNSNSRMHPEYGTVYIILYYLL